MIKITKSQKEALEKAGLIRYKKTDARGIETESPNIYIANREHMSRDKTYYVVEEYKIMSFLGLADKKPHKKTNNWNKNRKNSRG